MLSNLQKAVKLRGSQRSQNQEDQSGFNQRVFQRCYMISRKKGNCFQQSFHVGACLSPKICIFYVIIMLAPQTLKFKSTHHMLQTTDQKALNIQNSPQTSNMTIFSQKYQKNHSSQTSNTERIKAKHWSQAEQHLYTQFWLQKFIQNPCENFSLDAPLNRKSYNKEASDYITNKSKRLQFQCHKTTQQCKSKFGTIRRRVLRDRKNQRTQSFQFGFIDFIIRQAQNLMSRDESLREKIQKVKDLRQNQGPFVKIALQEYKFQKSHPFQATFILLSDFILKNQKGLKTGQTE